ncbi:MAG: FAD-dependent oxidoreductase [Myxococcota bacterium]|nr:FAD-dependent oxidoreductase [Myxococcota bacterium]
MSSIRIITNFCFDTSNLRARRMVPSARGGTGSGLLKINELRGGKYDLNNLGPISTDYVGASFGYPDGDYAAREKILDDHKTYQMGLLYFLSHDPDVPIGIRQEVGALGLASDEFIETDGWSQQLYVREARRLKGRYVMTEHNAFGRDVVEDPIALASYPIDSHHVQRIVGSDGVALNEGNVTIRVPEPFPISYRALTPLAKEARNLLVASAISASHTAYGSIRMEPVFFALGQAAGAAASLAIDQKTSVQDVDYSVLRKTLLNEGVILEWDPDPSFSDLYLYLRNYLIGE